MKEEEEDEPRIYNLQWVKEKTIIRNSQVLKQITLRADVYNIGDGTSINFTVKIPNEGKGSEDELISLSGIVKDKQVEVTWEIEDIEERNTIES